MDEILKRDQNHVTVLAGVTNDVDKDIVMLRVDPTSKALLVKTEGGTVSFGTAGQIPFTNTAGDDFEYDDEVTFSKTDRRLELKGQGGTKGLLGFDVQDDTKTRVFEAENTTLNLMTRFHIAQDFSSGVSDQDSYSWGMDRTGLAFYHGNDESSWGYYLYESSDGYVYNPSYYQDFNENLDFGGEISAKHLLGRSDSTPTAVAGTGAGTSPTISVEGTDTAMRVVVTAGTTPATNATVATITFDQPFTNRPIVVASAGNVTAAARAAVMHFDAANRNELTIKVGATALTAAAGYVWNIHVIGRK